MKEGNVMFGMADGNSAPLLLASISSNFASDAKKLSLPRLVLPGVHLPNLPMAPKSSARASARASSTPNLAQAGAEAQRLVALVGGILIASFGRAAQHVGAFPHRPLFHNSFKLPWQDRTTEARTSRESEALALNLVARGREYERSLDVRAAVQCFDEAARLSPRSLAALCLAAKMWSDLTFYHDVRSERERQLVNLKALEYAERAVAAHPEHPGGYLSTCISKGRLALFMDNKSKVRLAKEAQEAAHTALQYGPEDDLAHHLMGRWHYEMARINPLVRTAVRVMYGTTLRPGTKEDALAAYNRAAELAPSRLVHHAEAGRVLLELGDHQAARVRLERALTCEVEDINAWHTRMDAEKLLAVIDRRPWRQPSLVPPGVAGKSASVSTAALLGVPESVLKG